MQQLLLLHGAIGTMDQFLSLKEELDKMFEVYCFNFSGHGNSCLPGSFSMESFAEETSNFIKIHQLNQPLVFGYSMGGYIAMYTELTKPGTFGKIATLGTKFQWNEAVAAKEIKMLQPDIIEQKVPAFAQQLAIKHGIDQWKQVLLKTAEMLTNLGNNPLLNSAAFGKIYCPSVIMIGEKDNMVSLEECMATAKSLPNSTFILLPDTAHPIEQVNTELLAKKLIDFFV